LFADLPLVGPETPEDYEGLFNGIAEAVNPTDAIVWLFVRQIADLSWGIKREKNLKWQVLENEYVAQVRRCLIPESTPGPFDSDQFLNLEREESEKAADVEMKKWATDATVISQNDLVGNQTRIVRRRAPSF
jgi:hypothetical protein